LTRDLPIERFILFSSGASLLGSPGQGNYAAANAFLDALAHHRRAQGRPVTCINWGPWSEVGLAARPDRGGRLEARGIGSFTPAEGVEVFARIIRDSPVQVGALRLDVRQWRQFYPKAAQSPLLSEILGTDPHAATAVAHGGFRAALLALESGWQRQAMLEKQLREEIAQVLRLSPNRIDRETPLQNLGLDSLMALELRNRLEASLGLTLSATLIWGYPTVAALAPHLAARMGIALDVAETASATPSAETPEDVNAVAALSADDTRARLEAELDGLSEELLGRD
jgi:myxalamid-type polyketide synthase MxaE and MxaD